MKNINKFIVTITNHHLNIGAVLTPICVSAFEVDGVVYEMVYVFGIRVIRINTTKPI
jgi:hypothetical protein